MADLSAPISSSTATSTTLIIAKPTRTQKLWKGFALVAIAGIGLVTAFSQSNQWVGLWVASLTLLVLLVYTLGQAITHRLAGIFIDEDNRMSLSRFQMVMWTILFMAAFTAAAFGNMFLVDGPWKDPLNISIPTEVWALMGISVGSMVGSPLIKGLKKGNEYSESEKQYTLELLDKKGHDTSIIDNQGAIIVRDDPFKAMVFDMFTGEEVGNAGQVDLGKLQMFLITIITLVAYGVCLTNMFSSLSASRITTFPEFSQQMVFLLGISHAGYLASKAVPHSAPSDGPTAATVTTTPVPAVQGAVADAATTAGQDDDAIG